MNSTELISLIIFIIAIAGAISISVLMIGRSISSVILRHTELKMKMLNIRVIIKDVKEHS